MVMIRLPAFYPGIFLMRNMNSTISRYGVVYWDIWEKSWLRLQINSFMSFPLHLSNFQIPAGVLVLVHEKFPKYCTLLKYFQIFLAPCLDINDVIFSYTTIELNNKAILSFKILCMLLYGP